MVDAVLSEDVDTVMFGCTKSLRNWSSENGKSSSTPTHISVYDAKQNGGTLDREAMILVALMSGGDYSPDGLPGCGIKVACEAARAGYGKTLCRLKTTDEAGFQKWRDELSHDLKTNELRHFQTKHKALKIPSDWPDIEILRYYTHPVVSPISVIDALRPKLDTLEPVKLEHLREFTREEFGWDFRIGALKFIRVLTTALLLTKLQREEEGAQGLVKRISSRREHFSADGEPELRLSYVPSEVVPIDISQEVEENIPHTRDALAVNGDDEEIAADVEDAPSSQPRVFDPTKPEAAWIAEEFATRTIPSVVTAWKQAEADKAMKKASKKQPSKKKRGTSKVSGKDAGMVQGALDSHFKVTKSASSKIVTQASKTTEVVTHKEVPPQSPPSSFTQHHTAPTAGMRPPSKPPTPTRAKDQKSLSGVDVLASSPVTPPRTQTATTRAEAIFISSSPPCATTPHAVSSESRARPFGSAKVSDDVFTGDPKTTASQDIRANKRQQFKAKVKPKTSQNPTSSPSKLKQTSITMFATRSTRLSSRQPGQNKLSSSQYALTQSQGGHSDASQPRSFAEPEESYIDDSSVDLPALSSSLSGPPASPKSPGKRLKSPARPGRDESPTRASKSKKTLLVPDDNGYIRALSVDATKRDELEASETRRLARKGVHQKPIRQSDVTFIDLTEE